MNSYDEQLRDLIARTAVEYHVDQGDEAVAQCDNRELLDWLRQSPLHVSEYLGLMSAEGVLSQSTEGIDIPLEQLISEARADVVNADVLPFPGGCRTDGSVQAAAATISVTNRHHRQLAYAGIAASLIGVWLAAAVFVGNPSSSRGSTSEFITSHGEQRTWELSDNTVVHLNSATKINVKFDHNSRTIDVAYGQAYLEVGKDPTRPFHARVGNVTLQDIGTKFDISREDKDVVVTVVEGRVAIWASNSKENSHTTGVRSSAMSSPVGQLNALRLGDIRSGQQATILASGQLTTNTAVDIDRATAWVRQQIILDRETIGQAAIEFNRYNQVQIHIDDPQVAAYRISGVFRCYDSASFVAFLGGLQGVQVVRSADMIRVMPTRGGSHPTL